MVINKISYKNEIMEVHYSVLKKGGKEDYFTIRSGDQPLPSFRNLLMKLRPTVIDMMELPNNDEEVKRITINQVSFDYSGDDNVMGAVISAKRKLNYSGTNMALNTPHKFAKKAKGASSSVFNKAVIDLLEDLQDEAEKYVNGERQQGELFDKKTVEAKSENTADEIIRKAMSKKKAEKSKEKKKKFSVHPTGPEEPGFAIKSKGKYLKVSPGYAVKLTAFISEDGVLQDSVHEGMKEIGYAGNKLLFEIDGGLLQIHSAVIDYKQMNNDSLAKNAIEELIQDFVDQPILRLKNSVDLTLVPGVGETAVN